MHLLWEQQQRSWMLEKPPWSMVHLGRVSINMAVVHERPFIAWCACQMAYKSRSSLVLLSQTLQAILLWQYGDWPLSWAACGEPQWGQASRGTMLKRAHSPLLRVWIQTHLQGSSCSHFIMCLLEESPPPPVKWTWLFNPDHCLRNAKWNTVANLHHDLGTFDLNSRLGGFHFGGFYSLLSLIY